MKLLFVHIKGSKKGHSEVFDKEKIAIGSDPSCCVIFDKGEEAQVEPFHAEVSCEDGKYNIRNLSAGHNTYVNNEPVESIALNDGDVVVFGENGPEVCVRFSDSKKLPASLKVVAGMLDSMEVSNETTEKLKEEVMEIKHSRPEAPIDINLFKYLVWLPFKQSSKKVKFYVALSTILIISVLSLAGYFYFFELKKTTKRVLKLETQQTVTEDFIETYRKSVCFIQGSYYLASKKTGNPLRTGRDGKPFMRDFTGSGFLSDKTGIIITNRHVADPVWQAGAHLYNKESGRDGPGVEARFAELRAFFPGIKGPFPLEIVKMSKHADIAVLKIKSGSVTLPPFNFDRSGKEARIGEPVILLGYPAGINAIFGKSDQETINELIKLPVLEIAEELSNRNLITPIITQGHITDISPGKIIYDAQTTFGGSGGPLINSKGEVIGINYGILREFKGSNFAVPIKYGIELLDESAER